MPYTPIRTRLALAASLAIVSATGVQGQGRGGRGGPPEPPKTARAGALYDITRYWVSAVTEDWRFRMVTPPKGDYTGVALNEAGRKFADAWDPAKDEAAGEQCKSYGAPNLMRVPGRLHITWQDDQTLKIESDAGQQTRVLHFARRRSGLRLARFFQGALGNGAGGPGYNASGFAESGNDAPEAWIFAEEWRALQRERDVDRILRSSERAERRCLPGHHHHRRGSRLSRAAVFDRVALSKAAGCQGLESGAMFGKIANQGIVK